MDDKLKNVRQPLVTATGILLGFTLNIAANWLPKAFTTRQDYRIPDGIKPLHTYSFIYCSTLPNSECELSKRQELSATIQKL